MGSVKQSNMALTFVLMLLVVTLSSASKNCVPIDECPSLLNLVKNSDSLPDMTIADVYSYLKDMGCGFDGSKPMVNCPQVEEVENDSDNQCWMLDGENMLKNKAGVWKPVKVDLPTGENEGKITNKIDDKVLTVIKDEVVWQEYSDGNDTNQIWTRGVPFSESLQSENCFTLQNRNTGLYLTATGGDTLEIQAQEDQVGRFGGGIFDFDADYSCAGNLTLIHTALHLSRGLNPALEELHSMRTARLTGQRYFNLQKRMLESRKLLHVENVGDCCWQFNSLPRFRGDLQYASIGFAGLPKKSPKSIRRVLCDIVRRQIHS